MNKKFLIVLIVFSMSIFSCSKEEGEGGRSSIVGHVFAKNYNASFTQLLSSYYAPEEDVYIIYGDNENYDDRVKTGPDGAFEFKHLRKGNYKIYVYTKDTTFTIASGVEAIYESVEIKDKEEVIELPDFEIIK
ncbi:MAG: hypothetical protein COA97_09990 [Flavobacteriales bacterium]|nr:MAG: hypothetical protein COA97_09990 [Flavobacteriales bacterium]